MTALGVVYGDIGTSPLYAIRECFHGEHGIHVSHGNVLGVLSLMFWALTIVISLKYVAYVLRADNRGEGGILAMMALALQPSGAGGFTRLGALTLGLFGAALLYGDGMITPAISVLSAVEGLNVAAPGLSRFVVPITIVILIGLFMFQKHGTARVGAIFGPITLVWFFTLAALGVWHIVQNPGVLWAVNPVHGARFLVDNGVMGFLVLGAVFLVVTGGEALYADMGHFGARPIRLTWFSLVFPALLLNYFGQGALILSEPRAVSSPFYRMVPAALLYPVLLLATCATIIASQAVISGAFSLTRQAIMLGYWPRIQVSHTSDKTIGQIYVPTINWMLMLATIGLVLGFRSSSNLAAAYGIAVTTSMVIETLMAFVVARHLWKWPLPGAIGLTALLVSIDLSFFGANVVKISHGGWFPLLIAAGMFTLMTTWKRGRELLGESVRRQIIPLIDFSEVLRVERPARVPGTAVFMTSNATGTPPALLQNFLLNRVVHSQVALLTIVTEEIPRVDPAARLTVERLDDGFVRLTARYGFMEQPNVPELLVDSGALDCPISNMTFFMGRENVLADGKGGMGRWRGMLFSFMSRNAQRAPAFFHVPNDRVLELGSQVTL
jgi:KUP system potassium uptake protein